MFRLEEENEGGVRVYDQYGNLLMCIGKDEKFNRNLKNTDFQMGFNSKRGSSFLPSVIIPDCNKNSRRSLRNKPTIGTNTETVDDYEKLVEATNEIDDECIDQESFLSCFGLKSNSVNSRPPLPSKSVKTNANKDLGKYFKNGLLQFDFSSRLGWKGITDKHVVVNPIDSVAKYDKFCATPKRRLANGEFATREASFLNNYTVTFEPKADKESSHKYCFTRSQKIERLKTIDAGLNKRARGLKRKCRRVKIVLKRLSVKEIKKWTTPSKTVVLNKHEVKELEDANRKVMVSILKHLPNDLSICPTITTTPSKIIPLCLSAPIGNNSTLKLKSVSVALKPLSGGMEKKTKEIGVERSTTPNGRNNTSNIQENKNATQKLHKSRSVNGEKNDGVRHSAKGVNREENSDSDVEIVYCKVGNVQPNSKSIPEPKVTMTYVFESADRNGFNFCSTTLFRCKLCSYECQGEENTILEHVKSSHPNCKEVRVLHKLEFNKEHRIYYKALEAYPT